MECFILCNSIGNENGWILDNGNENKVSLAIKQVICVFDMKNGLKVEYKEDVNDVVTTTMRAIG